MYICSKGRLKRKYLRMRIFPTVFRWIWAFIVKVTYALGVNILEFRFQTILRAYFLFILCPINFWKCNGYLYFQQICVMFYFSLVVISPADSGYNPLKIWLQRAHRGVFNAKLGDI